ncbi:MAG: hypothetical protein NC181_04370 [Clostridium sp.]|nr:hypothetical protein [Clostridium sp.]MCM1444526.1 hypothetical protein [Candidatus Amulumruptor caecigallinarius]
MKLNINFDPTLESTINLCKPLAAWFERNQETMAYFDLIHKGCLHFENSLMASADIKALGRMANAGLTWLEAPKTSDVSPEEKAINAAVSIASVYEEEKEKLSENAKVQYYLNVEELQKDDSQEKVRRI